MHRLIHNRYLAIGAVAVSCGALGAGASAIASAGAATPTSHSSHAGAAHVRPLAPWRLLRRTVHAQLVIHTKHGFVTATIDRGRVAGVSGDVLTLTEGTPKATYRTVQLTLPPSSTRVRLDGHRSTLGQLSSADRALVVEGPHRALVIAHRMRNGG